jgi:HKD family nuclease
MAHENNITKSYFVKGKEYFYNTPDPKHKTPDMSLPSEYGKQFEDVTSAEDEAISISKKLDKYAKHSKGAFIVGKGSDYIKDLL